MFGGPAPVSEKRVLGALPDMWAPSSSLPPLSLSTTQQRQPKKNTHTPFLSITQLPFSLLGCVSVMEGDGSVNESMVSKVEMVVEAVGDELELGLGLSLGGVGGKVGKGNYAWGERGRILTAKDFPSSSCVVSSSSNVKSAAAAVSGTKRAADESVPSEGGSPTSVSQVVGWPPIRAYRINSLVNQAKASGAEEDKATDDKDKSKGALKNKTSNGSKMGAASNEKGHLGFVKVNMDGIPIGRKVDLNAHGCYETLAQTLEEMFFPTQAVSLAGSGGEYQAAKAPSKLLDGSSEFVLTYEDKEGDCMLVGDVPWSMFLSFVKRLRIMRTSEANGLAPRFHQRNE